MTGLKIELKELIIQEGVTFWMPVEVSVTVKEKLGSNKVFTNEWYNWILNKNLSNYSSFVSSIPPIWDNWKVKLYQWMNEAVVKMLIDKYNLRKTSKNDMIITYNLIDYKCVFHENYLTECIWIMNNINNNNIINEIDKIIRDLLYNEWAYFGMWPTEKGIIFVNQKDGTVDAFSVEFSTWSA